MTKVRNAALKTVNPYPHGVLYKFQDENTGLFWTGSFEGPRFVEKGLELRSKTAAEEMFRSYEFRRARVYDHIDALPILTLVTYRVITEEIGRETFSATEAEMRVTRMAELYGKQGRLDKFVRQLFERKDFMEFTHIIQRVPKVDVDLLAVHDPVMSSRKTERKFIAIRSDKDLLFLRMSMGEAFVEAYDLSTGDKVFAK